MHSVEAGWNNACFDRDDSVPDDDGAYSADVAIFKPKGCKEDCLIIAADAKIIRPKKALRYLNVKFLGFLMNIEIVCVHVYPILSCYSWFITCFFVLLFLSQIRKLLLCVMLLT